MLVDRCDSGRGGMKPLKAEKEVNSRAPGLRLVLDRHGQGSSRWGIYHWSVLHVVYFYDYNVWSRQLAVWAYNSADADPRTRGFAL